MDIILGKEYVFTKKNNRRFKPVMKYNSGEGLLYIGFMIVTNRWECVYSHTLTEFEAVNHLI